MVDERRASEREGGNPGVEVVTERLQATPPEPVTAAIHGSIEPGEIAGQIVGVLSSSELPQPIAECLFHVASVGSVTGIALTDGTRLVVKAYQPAWKSDFLRGVIAAQEKLWQAGVPSKAERRAALAAALWSLCYTARCEHAIDPSEHVHLRSRPRLRQDATRFQQALAR